MVKKRDTEKTFSFFGAHKKNFCDIVSILIFIEIILSVYLIYSESQSYGYCIIGSTCETVQNSDYGSPMGIPLAWLGFFAFVILLILFYVQNNSKVMKSLFLASAIIGAFYGLYLIIVQAFIIKNFCGICMIIDPIAIIVAVLAIMAFREDIRYKKK